MPLQDSDCAPEIFMGQTLGKSVPEGHALWEYTEDGWKLKKDRSKTGAIPGPAPTVAGQFIGQLRATASRSMHENM